MQLPSEQIVQLIDQQGRQVGRIEIERREEHLIFGRFVPAPAFSTMQHLFQKFEEAVDAQTLTGLTLRGINRPQWEAVAVLRASSD